MDVSAYPGVFIGFRSCFLRLCCARSSCVDIEIDGGWGYFFRFFRHFFVALLLIFDVCFVSLQSESNAWMRVTFSFDIQFLFIYNKV